jgi:FxLD family lantipeptide
MSQTQQAPGAVEDRATAFDLDITIVEGGGEVDMLPMNTDNGCGSTCPNACTGSGVKQMC